MNPDDNAPIVGAYGNAAAFVQGYSVVAPVELLPTGAPPKLDVPVDASPLFQEESLCWIWRHHRVTYVTLVVPHPPSSNVNATPPANAERCLIALVG